MPDQDPLAQLRDIHLPQAISAWPPAPGWWILAVLLLALLAAVIYFIFKRIKANRYRRLAIKQLDDLASKNQQSISYLQQLNGLLKQTAMIAQTSTATTISIARLSGQQWLQFLDQSSGTTQFQQSIGNVLADGPYSATEMDTESKQKLQRLALHWIKKHDIKKVGRIN